MKTIAKTGIIGIMFLCGVGMGIGIGMAQEPPPVLGTPANVASPPPPPPPPEGRELPPPLPGTATKISPPPAADALQGEPSQRLAPPPLGKIPSIEEAVKAVAAAQHAVHFLRPGSIWVHRGPAGDVVFKAALMYHGRCVAVVEFDPGMARLLPKGYCPIRHRVAVPNDRVKREFPSVVGLLSVLNGAEYREREAAWAIPIAYRGAIVAHLKISRDGTRVMPDYPEEQEMRVYDQ